MTLGNRLWRGQIATMSLTTRALDWRGRGADVDVLLAHVDQLQDGEVRVSTGSFEKASADLYWLSVSLTRMSFSCACTTDHQHAALAWLRLG